MTDPLILLCHAYLRSYKKRAGKFPTPAIERKAQFCAIGARCVLTYRKWPSSKIFRQLLVADFDELETMMRAAK